MRDIDKRTGAWPTVIVGGAVVPLLVAFVALFSLVVGSAGAVPPAGVHVDPGSPVAKEYAIPLAAARGGGSSSGSSGGPLFGRGITRSSSSEPAASVVASAGGGAAPSVGSVRPSSVVPVKAAAPAVGARFGRSRRRRRRSAARVRSVVGRAVVRVRALARVRLLGSGRPAAGTGLGIAWMFGVAAVVLALGGVGGVVVARHGRRTGARTS